MQCLSYMLHSRETGVAQLSEDLNQVLDEVCMADSADHVKRWAVSKQQMDQ